MPEYHRCKGSQRLKGEREVGRSQEIAAAADSTKKHVVVVSHRLHMPVSICDKVSCREERYARICAISQGNTTQSKHYRIRVQHYRLAEHLASTKCAEANKLAPNDVHTGSVDVRASCEYMQIWKQKNCIANSTSTIQIIIFYARERLPFY